MANACSSPPLKSCPLKVTDLPTDILREIFDYFKDARMARPGRVDWTWSKSYDDLTKKRQAVLSSRLVCRRLRDMASPLLLPTVRVKLERESLSRFEEISRIPEVAASVRGIEIVLSCRSGELATDLGRFITHRKEDIRIVRDVEPHFAEIEQAWDDYLKDPTVDTVGNKYQTLLRESFSEYKRRHDEQMELVESGTFVDTIASAVSRMPLFGSLLFDDADIYAGHLTPDEREAPSLSLALTAAKSWTALEAMSVELTAARVLSDLPIAIHKAGVSLRELCVFCFPTTEHIGAPLTQDIDLLRAAYQYLEEVILWPIVIPHPSYTTEGIWQLNQYLGTMLSGHSLDFLYVDGRGRTSGSPVEKSPVGAALGSVDGSRLKRVYIDNARFTQSEIDGFCAGLGYQLEELSFGYLEIVDGTWEVSRGIIREKTASRCDEGECEVSLFELTSMVGMENNGEGV